MNNQKGFLNLILILVLLAAITSVAFHKFYKPTATPQQLNNESSVSAKPVISSTTTPIVQVLKKSSPSCDVSKDVCFESGNLKVTIMEDYLEDNDKWITDTLYITGKGSGGFEFTSEGFPGEFTFYTPNKGFGDGSKDTIFVRAYKNVAKKGTYQGKVSVKSLATGKVTTANLTLNYVDWNDSAIHLVPDPLTLNCDIKNDSPNLTSATYIDCKEWNDLNVKFYYGRHGRIEVKSVPDPGSIRSLMIKTEDENTIFDTDLIPRKMTTFFHDFPANHEGDSIQQSELGSEPNGVYTGNFVFVDSSTQKELLKVPYTLKINNLTR